MDLLSFLGKSLLPVVLSAIMAFVLSDPVRRYYGYFIDIARNTDHLFQCMELLESKTKDLPHGTHEAEAWANQVKALKEKVDNFKDKYEAWKGNAFFSRAMSRYGIAMRAGDLFEKVDLLASKTVDGGRLPLPPPVQERDASESILGLDSALNKALDYLKWESQTPPSTSSDLPVRGPRVIGIFGMGGIGKTTLLKQINNHLALEPTDNVFDHVVWIAVSKDVNLEKLQEELARRLGLCLQPNQSVQERADVIRNYMKDKNFLLLLDDLWVHLDLEELGIPNPQEGGFQLRRKVVFTTRFENVCDRMQAMDTKKERMKVALLTKSHAWQLFRRMLGDKFDDTNHEIGNLARAIAKQCRGLPLALKVIGAAMSSRQTLENWEDALDSLKDSQPISGTEEGIFHILKQSYDYLNDDKVRECFLCCALWSDDWTISNDELIQCWMGLGLLDRHQVDEKYRVGREYIQTLKAACLLEDGFFENREVKMHDVIRDMALQIASDEHKWMVRAGIGLEKAPRNLEQWAAVKRVSLMKNRITNLSIFEREEGSMEAPLIFTELSTLVLQGNNLVKIPNTFFPYMPNLSYLDLSYNDSLEGLPREICDLTGLQYLNISFTGIRSLPQELGRLEKLRYLILNFTSPLDSELTLEVMPRALQLLDFYGSFIDWEARGEEILRGLKKLEVLGITVRSTLTLQMLSKFSHVHLRSIAIVGIDSPASIIINQSFGDFGHTMNHLQHLVISEISNLKELKVDLREEGSRGMAWNLRKLECLRLHNLLKLEKIIWRGVEAKSFLPRLRELLIYGCDKLENVFWVLQLPCLEHLTVDFCLGMKLLIDEIGTGEAAAHLAFPRLKLLQLKDLPKLESIYLGVLAFPSLEVLQVDNCSKLRSLPFRWPLTNSKIRLILGDQTWWDGLQWEDDRIRTSLHTHFILDC